MVVLAGQTRLEAARKLGFKTAPVHVAKGLTASQARAFRIMDNRSGENAEWDQDLLNLELADLLDADFDLGLTGFTEDELDALMSSLDEGRRSPRPISTLFLIWQKRLRFDPWITNKSHLRMRCSILSDWSRSSTMCA
jgi:ParB-like chromosome segregation protein Spo0J